MGGAIALSPWGSSPVLAQSITSANDRAGTVVTQNGQQFDINAGHLSNDGQNLFHSFSQFGLSQDQIANFIAEPNVLNILSRVIGGEASVINGQITVTGADANLYLMNPAGIFFGESAQLDVPASFTATTATGIGLDDGWFDALGDNNYSDLGGTVNQFIFNIDTPGTVFNAGELAVGSRQTLTLMGGNVTSVGTLSSDGGNIFLVATPGQSMVSLRPDGHVLGLEINPLDRNDSAIAQLDPWTLPVVAMPEFLTGGHLNHANSLTVNPDGSISLISGLPINTDATSINISGTVDASTTGIAQSGTPKGGAVAIAGGDISLLEASIDVAGAAGGGQVIVGGYRAGAGAFPQSDRTYLSSNTSITADAVRAGTGGEVIIYGHTTGFFGDISAQGGQDSGNGGFVEISGRQNLIYQGTVNVAANNISHQPGTVFIDPENIVIEPGTNPGVSGFTGELLATDNPGETTTLFQSDLEAIAGNIILEATNDITINPLNNGRLTLQPGGNRIIFRADADGNAQGDFSMATTDTLYTNGNNLTIEGANLTLGNVNTLLLGDVIADNPGNADVLTEQLGFLLFDSPYDLLQGDADNLQDVVRGDVQLTATGDIATGILDTHIPAVFQEALLNLSETRAREVLLRVTPDDKGEVVLQSADGMIRVDSVNTSSVGVEGSNVILETEGDVEVGIIDTSATLFDVFEENRPITGGDVTISGDQVRITETNADGASIITAGSSGTTPEFPDDDEPEVPIDDPIINDPILEPPNVPGDGDNPLNTGGTVSITHQGGADNTPFEVGDASENGTAGSIKTGTDVGSEVTAATDGPFQVVTDDPGVVATGSNNVTILSINSAPVTTGTASATTTSATTTSTTTTSTTSNEGVSVVLSLNEIMITDIDDDNTVFQVTSIKQGVTLTRSSGEAIAIGDTLTPEEQLIYTPTADETGVVDLLTIAASDRVSLSTSIAITVTIEASPEPTSPTPTDPIPVNPTPTDHPTVIIDIGTPPNYVAPEENPDGVEPPPFSIPPNSNNPNRRPGVPDPNNAVRRPGIPDGMRRVVDRIVSTEVTAQEQMPILPPVEFYTVNTAHSIENTTHFSRVERSFSKEFTTYLDLDLSEPTTSEPEIPDIGPEGARSLASEIETATGERPGFIYVNFVPRELTQGLALEPYEPHNTDELELTVITAKGGMIRRRVPGVTRGQVVRMAQQLRRDITVPTRNATRHLPEAQQLYQWLVTPIQDQLEQHNITNLSFLAEAGVRSLPFAALHDGTDYLVETYSVGMMPSLNLTNTEYVDVREISMLAMGISESIGGQSPLPAVPTELSTLIFDVWKGKLFLNEDATMDTLKGARKRTPFGIIHMATHATFQDGPYDNSFIQLWNDRLNMSEIRDLDWNNPPVEMLVLSACQTALGSREAELGFAGLAVQAGVKTAIASLWTVDDMATMSLMSQFYNTLNTAPIKSEALRQAQLALIQGDVRMENGMLYVSGLDRGIALPPDSLPAAIQDLSHPYFWSAFTIVGNPW